MAKLQFSVAQRVYAAFGMIIVLMLGLLGLALGGLHSVSSGLETYQQASGRATQVSSVLDLLSRTRLAFASYDAEKSEANASALNEGLARFDEGQAAVREAGLIPAGPGIDATLTAYASAVAAILAIDAERATVWEAMNGSGIAATQTLSALIEQTSQSANLNAKAAALSGLAMQQILTTRLTVEAVLANPAPTGLDAVTTSADEALAALADLRSTFFKTDDVARVDSVTVALKNYRENIDTAYELLVQRQTQRAILGAIDAQLSDGYAARVADITQGQERAGVDVKAQAAWTLGSAVLLGSAAVMVGAALAFLMARWLSSSIGVTARAMERLAAGQLDLEIAEVSTAQEFRQMTSALATFRDNGRAMARLDAESALTRERDAVTLQLRAQLQDAIARAVAAAAAGDFSQRLAEHHGDPDLDAAAQSLNGLLATIERGLGETGEVLSALARTDLTRRVEGSYDGAFARLKADTNAVAERLGHIVGQLRHTSGSLKTATGEILSGANDLSERTTKQAATIEETSAAMEQLASTVLKNAQRAKDASANAAQVTRTAEEGGQVMDAATSAMERITQSSAKISNIIGMIDDIAFQTNLLALNASVEAARAGDAGKGFAVVAVEVRRLAQSAAQASSEVKVLIEQSAGEVSAGSKLVGDAAGKLKVMLEAARGNNGLLESIANDSREQASAIEEVTTAVRTMDEMTQHNAALVEETNAAIEQTEAQATELDRIVDVFRIEQEQPMARAERPAAASGGARGLQQRLAKASVNLSTHGNAALAPDWNDF